MHVAFLICCNESLYLYRSISFECLIFLYIFRCVSTMKELFLAAFSVISSLFVVLVLVCLGWYLVWKLFLSRFRFVRELLGGMTESSSVSDLKNGRSRIKKTRRD